MFYGNLVNPFKNALIAIIRKEEYATTQFRNRLMELFNKFYSYNNVKFYNVDAMEKNHPRNLQCRVIWISKDESYENNKDTLELFTDNCLIIMTPRWRFTNHVNLTAQFSVELDNIVKSTFGYHDC